MKLIIVLTLATLLISPCSADELSKALNRFEGFLNRHCIDCHSGEGAEADLDLTQLPLGSEQFLVPQRDLYPWEQIYRRINSRQMPPVDYARPAENEYQSSLEQLQKILDIYATRFPSVPRVGPMRRLTRTEYQNAIRDLLGLEIDASRLLPKDESSHKFDNITVEDLSSTRLNRYVLAAQKISRLAVGNVLQGSSGTTIRIPPDRTQEEHVNGLPFGSRGGVVFNHHFPAAGEYEIELKLARDRDEAVEGLNRKHHIDVLIDRQPLHRFTVVPPRVTTTWENRDFTNSDAHLKTRLHVDGGTHSVGITFPKTFSSLVENKRQPFQANFNRHRHPRKTPAIYQVSIVGPFGPTPKSNIRSLGTLGFSDYKPGEERKSASQLISQLMRRAYRRSIKDQELNTPMAFFDEAFAENGFATGIEAAVSAILVNPNFLFKIESSGQPGTIHKLNQFELASRISFFLWSSVPDEELLALAEQERLDQDDILIKQVERMIRDPRAESLVNHFAAQWLYLRNLESITPDLRQFPDFDDNLRQAFRGETEHLFRDMVQNDRSALSLIRSNHTFLNERLAHHYGIDGIRGDHFRKVSDVEAAHRGGILRQGSILMVTSYATRTSPTIRGNWVLDNILGTPAKPPPPNVPELQENKLLENATLRERLAQHRANPDCASCHNLMDPIGFALENYDAVGRWRDFEESGPIDSFGTMPSGHEIANVTQLEAAILERPQVFVGALVEKLSTFALGRAIEPEDGPAIRRIIQRGQRDNYRFSSLVKGVVLSMPFRNRGD